MQTFGIYFEKDTGIFILHNFETGEKIEEFGSYLEACLAAIKIGNSTS